MMHTLRWFLVVVALSGAVSARGAVLRVRWDSPGYTQDGSNWGMAFRTVQAAVDAANPGDEIWVAKGVYREAVVIPKEVHLYGGFQAWDTRFEERNPAARVTVLDATDKWASVVHITDMAFGTVVDGFTIRGGAGTFSSDGYQWHRLGGGIYGEASSTISGNILEENRLSMQGWNTFGGAVFVDAVDFRVERNIIRNNAARYGGGISAMGSGIVRNNLVTGNIGGLNITENVSVVNNTILLDHGIGLRLGLSIEAECINNVVAYCDYGVVMTHWSNTFRHNCVFSNSSADYATSDNPHYQFDITGQYGNISRNPYVIEGDLTGRISPRSACIDMGEDSLRIGNLDLEGQVRIQGAHVDIGADEFDYSAPIPPSLARAYVRSDGDDNSDGTSWATALRTVAAGIAAVEKLQGEVWIANGTYEHTKAILNGVSLYGGFAGTETSRDERNPAAHPTVLERLLGTPGLRIFPVSGTVTLDGLTWIGPIRLEGANVIISRCAVRSGNLQALGGHITVSDTVIDAHQGGFVAQIENAEILFRRSVFRGGGKKYTSYSTYPESYFGCGVILKGVRGTITETDITENAIVGYPKGLLVLGGAGLYATDCDLEIEKSRITDNKVGFRNGGGLYAEGIGMQISGGRVRIGNCVIAGNGEYYPQSDLTVEANGTGLGLRKTDAVVVNNVILGNGYGPGPTSAVHVNGNDGGAFAIANNIIAFNDGGISAYQATPSILNNDLFGNAGKHPMEVIVTPGVNGNIAADPRFVDHAGGDFHIRLDSPCREAGTSAYLRPGDTDIDGDPRWLGLRVDIGVDELTYRMRRPSRKGR